MADTPILAQYRPGDVVRFANITPSVPIDYFGPWLVVRVMQDGSLLLRQGTDMRVAEPKEVRR